MKLYDDAVLEAAANREAGDSVGAWRLADALAAAIPDANGTNQHSRPEAGMLTVPEQLADYAAKLAAEDIHTPAGDLYTARSLEDLRGVANVWPATERHSQAAYRTHREAGSPKTEAAVALKALCKYADGGAKRKPTGIDSADWAKAIKVVDRLIARKAKYAVSANALRLAAKRKINTPPRENVVPEPVTVTSVAATVKNLPTKDRTALARELASAPETRKVVESAVREVKSDELAAAHKRFEEEHAGKRTTRRGGPDDAPQRVIGDQPLAVLGVLIETEPMKDGMPKVVQIVSDKRDLLADDDIEYLREWSATMRRHLDILDELLKLGTGLTDEALEGLLKGE